MRTGWMLLVSGLASRISEGATSLPVPPWVIITGFLLGDEAKIEEIFAGSTPFMLMLAIALAIIIAFPILSTFLPSLM